jgi:hypothetical protein
MAKLASRCFTFSQTSRCLVRKGDAAGADQCCGVMPGVDSKFTNRARMLSRCQLKYIPGGWSIGLVIINGLGDFKKGRPLSLTPAKFSGKSTIRMLELMRTVN